WSPDGTKIVFAAGKANGGIYVVNLDGSGLAKLTSSGQKPDWSPDGTRIVFSANGTLLITNSDGRSGFETLPSFSGGEFPRWSPDGTKILFSKGDGLYVVDLEAGRSNLTKIYDEIPSTFVGSPDWQRLLGKQSTLTVKSQDPDGNPITGYWTVLYDSNGSVLNTGFTPATFTLNSGQQYKIGMGDYGSYSFDHWLDNLSAQNPRNISGNSNAQLIAIYKNANAFPIIHMQDKTESYGVPISPDSNHQIAAEWVKPLSALVGKKIDSVTLKLQRIDNPTGAAQIVVFDVNKNVKKSFGSILAGVGAGSTYHSDIPTTMTEIEFRLPSSDPGYTIQADDRIGILWSGGSANAGSISVMMDKVISDSLFDGTNTQRIRGTPTGWYSSDTGEDLWMVLKQTHG
ncbi:MAG: TolB family protein, partial [Nitrososphaera sp.]